MNLRNWLLLVFLLLTIPLTATEQALCISIIGHKEGLSNSAVLSIYRDSTGLMWFGTYDGLNCYDGKRIEVFHTDFSANTTLENNIIANIQPAGEHHIWVCSYTAASRFHLSNRTVTENHLFDDDFRLVSNNQGNTWVFDSSNLYYYNQLYRKFIKACSNPGFNTKESSAYVDAKGELTLVGSNHKTALTCSVSAFNQDTLATRIETAEKPFHKLPLKHVDFSNDFCCFTDTQDDLYLFDMIRKTRIYLTNVKSLTDHYGQISNLTSFKGDILVSFQSHGILRLRMSERYAGETLKQNLRVFCTYVDSRQDMLWVGTDGQGVLSMARKNDLVDNILLRDLSTNLSGQVRGIITDPYGQLWIGTKGDGLLRIPDYENRIDPKQILVYSPKGKEKLSSYERNSEFYPVFTMKESRYTDGFWVGMKDSAVYFYSQKNDRLQPISGSLGKSTTEVHAIYEQNDSTIWLATIGTGFHCIRVKREGEEIIVTGHRRYHFFSNQQELLEFSSICPQNDSILWLGSRGKGLVKFNTQSKEYHVISLKGLLGRSVDDILCMHSHQQDTVYIGTTTGLVIMNWNDRKLSSRHVGRENGLFNDMIHGIVSNEEGLLWLGTNKGLIKYRSASNESYTYYYSRGVEIGEFSDDSYYECPYSGNLFLGGVNGLLYLNRKKAGVTDYYPNLLLRSISFGKDRHYWEEFFDRQREKIVLPDYRNTFSLEFVAPDYQVSDIEYSFLLDGYDKQWSIFSKTNEAFYNNLPTGNYCFKVQYKKDILDSGYKEFSIPVQITAPWYRSNWALVLYVLAGLGMLLVLFRIYRLYLMQRFTARSNTPEAVHSETAGETELPVQETTPTFEQIKESLTTYLGKDTESLLKAQDEEQARFLLDIVLFIEEHLNVEDLSVAYLADHHNVSVRQFYRKFRNAIDLSPVDLIKRIRMNRAAVLLKTTDLSIQEVIDQIGISSRSYFYKEFAACFGMTPGAMREEHSQKADNSPQ